MATAKAKPSEPEPRESAGSGAVPSFSGALVVFAYRSGGSSCFLRGAVAEARAKTPVYDPDLSGPVLDDDFTDHKSVTDFYDQFESTVHLANDGQGMSDLEVLITLRACLRQHRSKSYDLLCERGLSNGTVKSDPGKVYQVIKTKHFMLSETQERRLGISCPKDGCLLTSGRPFGRSGGPSAKPSV